jgi:predicted peroxiredoxin
MKNIVLAAVTALGLGGAAHAQDAPELVTVIASGDAQTQLMGMVLTMQSMQQGADAHVLLCGPGGDLALKDAPASATAPQEPRGLSPQGLMQRIMENGATVEVCAIYLPNRGEGAEVLLDGITPADPAAMAARLLTPNARILSF